MIDEKLTLDGLIHEFFPDGDFCRELRFNHMMMEIGHKAVTEFKKSLWHDASEEPERYDVYIIKSDRGYIDLASFDADKWHRPSMFGKVVMWLDLKDISPKKGGEQC